jgi:hypothetical protein
VEKVERWLYSEEAFLANKGLGVGGWQRCGRMNRSSPGLPGGAEDSVEKFCLSWKSILDSPPRQESLPEQPEGLQ